MKAWFDVGSLKRCPVYKIDSEDSNSSKFILFGPDLAKFKQFYSLQELIDYSNLHGLELDFKNDS